MPYIKTRSVLSPVFNDEYQIFEYSTTPDVEYHMVEELYSDATSISNDIPTFSYDIFPESYKNKVGLTTSYFSRFTTNPNKYLRQFAQYTLPTGTFSTKFELQDFNKNLNRYKTVDFLVEYNKSTGFYFVVIGSGTRDFESWTYYGWDYSDSNDISNFHLTNYRTAYSGLSPSQIPAPTQSFLFTDRPLVSDMAEINYIPVVLWQGNGIISTAARRFNIAEYNSNGTLATYSTLSYFESSQVSSMYLKFKRPTSNISYVDIWFGATASSIELSKQNALTKTYRLENKCKLINDLNVKTIIFQNKFGTFDSFDFIELQNNYNITKGVYDSPINLEINKSVPMNNTFPPELKLPVVYTKSRTTDSRQARINNIKSEVTKTIATNNINREQLKWLEDLILSENVYEWRDEKYIPINIVQNSIVVKPINNIFSQLTLSYNYSQKRETR